jgi:hypothetical protein
MAGDEVEAYPATLGGLSLQCSDPSQLGYPGQFSKTAKSLTNASTKGASPRIRQAGVLPLLQRNRAVA